MRTSISNPRGLAAAAVLLAAALAASALCLRPTQQAKLVSEDTPGPDEFFGGTIALDHDTAVATASGKNQQTGAAYVYVRDRLGIWTQEQKLVAVPGFLGESFGDAASIEGDTLIVGASANEGSPGAAYVFTRTLGVWTQQQRLVGSDSVNDDAFGLAVALSGDTAVVGAYRKSGLRGAAYVFTRTLGVWTQQQKLVAPDPADGDFFGGAVALEGDTVVISATGKTVGQGAAYVFTRNPGTGVWTSQEKLVASDPAEGDFFGESVSISGDTVAVGADFENHAPPADTVQGAAYVFTRNGTDWTQQQKLIAPDGGDLVYFGEAVALEGDTLIVGAYGESVGRGSAYLFVRSGGAWSLQARIRPADSAEEDGFAVDVGLSGDTALFGAFGFNLNQGAAYVYTGLLPPPPVPYLLVSKATAKSNAARVEKSTITATGVIDTGPGTPDFAGAATFDVTSVGAGAIAVHLDVPAFIVKSKGRILTFSADGIALTIKPAVNGSSKAAFTFKAVTDQAFGVDPNAKLDFKFVNARYDARGSVNLKNGALKPGGVVDPALAVVTATGTVTGKKKDALTLVAGFPTTGVAPNTPEDLTVCFGNVFTTTVPAASFKLKNGVASLAVRTPGISKATVDYVKGTITLAAKGVDLGAFATGGNAVIVTVTLGATDRVAQVRMSRAKTKLAY